MNLPGLSAGGGAPTPPYPMASHAQAFPDLNRRKQINTLRIYNENVSEIQSDVHYRVDFDLSGGQSKASLFIFLPPGFPKDPPTLSLQAPGGFSHPWVNHMGAVVGAPGLQHYSSHSDLGMVVQAVKRELSNVKVANGGGGGQPQQTNGHAPHFQPQPPSMYQYNVPHYQQHFPTPHAQQPNLHQMRQPMAQNHAQVPQQQQSSIQGLNDLTEAQLKELASGDEAAARMFCRQMKKNPMLERYEREIKESREAIDSLLQSNSQVQSQIEETREDLLNRVTAVNGLKQEVSALAGQARSNGASLAPDELCRQLRDTTVEDEEASDALAEAFLAGEMQSGEEFLKRYLELRSRHHMKKVKLEQLRKMTRY